MLWQRLLRSAAAVLGAAVVGCDSAPLAQGANPGGPPSVLTQPSGVRPQKSDPLPIIPAKNESLPPPVGGARVLVTVVALIDGSPILDSEVTELAAYQLATLQMRPSDEAYKAEVKKIKSAALEQLIDREVLVRDAETKLKMSHRESLLAELKQEADEQVMQRMKKLREQYPGDEDLEKFLRSQGTSLKALKYNQRRVLLAQQYLRSNVEHDIVIRHQDIYDYYKSHPEEFRRSDSVQWQDIFIDAAKYPNREYAHRLAEGLVTQARAGGGDEFVKLGEKYDNGLAKSRKGAGIGTRREDITPPEASAVLFQMREGDVGPIVSVPAGFHVIRLVKRILPGQAPFDEEAQKAIREKLKNEELTRRSKEYIEELKKNYHIERFPF